MMKNEEKCEDADKNGEKRQDVDGEKGGPKSQLCQEKIDWEQRCFLVDL